MKKDKFEIRTFFIRTKLAAPQADDLGVAKISIPIDQDEDRVRDESVGGQHQHLNELFHLFGKQAGAAAAKC